jgi:hypothetical protein
MVPAKETAEEQLLRMIEGPSAPSPKGSGGGSLVGRMLDPLRDSWDALRRWIRGRSGAPARESGDAFLSQLRLASRVFWVVLAALGLYLIIDVVILQPAAPRLVAPRQSSGGGTVRAVEESGNRLQEYRQTLAARNPFRLEATRVEDAPASQTAQAKLQELIAKLTVVGINRGAVPEALIEDTESKRTHFVKVGDAINGVTISAIDQEGVKVSYEGEETVLK